MNTPIIEFEADFPGELKDLVGGLLCDNAYLCPLWMQKVTVGYRAYESENFGLQWCLNKDYRAAHLNVSPTFLNHAAWEQREMMIHEIIHSYTIPLKQVIFHAMEDMETQDPVKSIIERQVNRVMEQVTQDFAFAIARK